MSMLMVRGAGAGASSGDVIEEEDDFQEGDMWQTGIG